MDKKTTPLILLLGASGSGKSTVALEMIRRYGLTQTDSYTTREPRYYGEPGHTFIDYETCLSLMMDDKLVAYTQLDGALYGASQEQVDAADIYVIDPFGAKILLSKYKTDRTIFYVFLDVSHSMQQQRMIERGSAREVAGRAAFDESASALAHEVGNLYPCSLYLTNDDLEQTIRSIACFTGLKEI